MRYGDMPLMDHVCCATEKYDTVVMDVRYLNTSLEHLLSNATEKWSEYTFVTCLPHKLQ